MDTVFDGAPVPWDVLHDLTKRSTLISDADKFSVFKSLDPSRMSRSELYDILHLIGAEQKDGQYFIEFTPDDDILVQVATYSILPVGDDKIWELPDPSAAKLKRGKRTTGARVKKVIDSDDDSESESIPGLPDFSPAIVVPSMPTPPTFRVLNQPDTTVTVSTASENPESATHSQLGPLSPSVVYSAINAVIASNHLPGLPNPLPLPSTTSSSILNPTQVTEIASGLPALTPSQLELEAPVTGEVISNPRKGSKLKRKVAEKQDSEVKLPKSKKRRPTPPAPVRSSSRFVIVEF